MNAFTFEERKLLVKHVNAIFNFVKTEVSPFLRSFQILKFEVNPHEYPIMFLINAGVNPEIKFTRG